MKKHITAILCLAMCAAVLSGCSNNNDGNGANASGTVTGADGTTGSVSVSQIGETVEKESGEANEYDFLIDETVLENENVVRQIFATGVKSLSVRMTYHNTVNGTYDNMTDEVHMEMVDDNLVVYSCYPGMQSLVVADEAGYMQTNNGVCVMRQFIEQYEGLVDRYYNTRNFGISGFEHDITDKTEGDTYTINCKTKARAYLTTPDLFWGIPDNNAIYQTFVFDAKTKHLLKVSNSVKDDSGKETLLYDITYTYDEGIEFPQYYKEMTDPSKLVKVTYVLEDGSKKEFKIAKGAYLDYVIDTNKGIYTDKECTVLHDRSVAPMSDNLTLYIGKAPQQEQSAEESK